VNFKNRHSYKETEDIQKDQMELLELKNTGNCPQQQNEGEERTEAVNLKLHHKKDII
jgi:hypothetical protein